MLSHHSRTKSRLFGALTLGATFALTSISGLAIASPIEADEAGVQDDVVVAELDVLDAPEVDLTDDLSDPVEPEPASVDDAVIETLDADLEDASPDLDDTADLDEPAPTDEDGPAPLEPEPGIEEEAEVGEPMPARDRSPADTVELVTPAAPTANIADRTYTIPHTPHIDYWVSINEGRPGARDPGIYEASIGDRVEIIAAPQNPHVRIPDDATSEWIFTFTDPSDPTAVPIVSASEVVIEQGDEFTITGEHFTPDADVAGVIHSDPYDLGTRKAGADGKVVFAVKLPGNFPAGIHTVTLRQTDDSKVAKIKITVKTKTVSVNPGGGSTPGTSDGTAQTVVATSQSVTSTTNTAQGRSITQLAATGSDLSTLTGMTTAFFVLGLALTLGARRRR